jgi:anti-sigma factor RsiW
MTISDETLMAFADGELDGTARAAVELAMGDDPQIEKRITEHRAMRQRLQAAYSAELSEEIPDRLMRAARGAAPTALSNAGIERSASPAPPLRTLPLRTPPLRTRSQRTRSLRTGWRMPASMAAGLIVGLGVGYLLESPLKSPLMRNAGGAMIARGPLATALSGQLAAEQSPDSPVRIGLSFLAKSGDYCRTFVLSGAITPAGLACRRGAEWQIVTLTEERGAAAGGSGYRTAGSGFSATILSAVEGQIAGEPLDQAGEKAARGQHWKGPDR